MTNPEPFSEDDAAPDSLDYRPRGAAPVTPAWVDVLGIVAALIVSFVGTIGAIGTVVAFVHIRAPADFLMATLLFFLSLALVATGITVMRFAWRRVTGRWSED
ncbi:MAG: hypothetical protein ACREJC_03035 [Tepidisphaeraceae bacterium]